MKVTWVIRTVSYFIFFLIPDNFTNENCADNLNIYATYMVCRIEVTRKLLLEGI